MTIMTVSHVHSFDASMLHLHTFEDLGIDTLVYWLRARTLTYPTIVELVYYPLPLVPAPRIIYPPILRYELHLHTPHDHARTLSLDGACQPLMRWRVKHRCIRSGGSSRCAHLPEMFLALVSSIDR